MNYSVLHPLVKQLLKIIIIFGVTVSYVYVYLAAFHKDDHMCKSMASKRLKTPVYEN